MTSNLDTPRQSRGDRARTRAYVRDFEPAMGAYVVTVLAVTHWGHLDGTDPWRYAWALLPLVPVALVVRAVVRALHRCDEYARLLQLRALAASFTVAMLASVALGLLTIAGLPLPVTLLPWLVFAAGMATWLVTATVFARH